MVDGVTRERGVVEDVAYYEAGVGLSNRTIITLRGGRMLVFRGDVRDQFPRGREVEVGYTAEGDLLERKLR